MDSSNKSLCITSYNSTGFGIGAQHFISTLSLFSDILCIQEHFLLDSKDKNHSNTNKLRKALEYKYDMFIAPAYKDSNQVSRGRGKGGLATLWDKSLTKYVSKVASNSFRLQGTKFSFPGGTFLLLNTYFPCDPRTNNFDETELLTLLEEIRQILIREECIYNLVLGDLNCHFQRQSTFTQLVHSFFTDLKLKIFWEFSSEEYNIQEIDFTYSQVNNNQVSSSIIDHFIGNDIVINSVVDAGVLHDVNNPSNHEAIFTKLNLQNIDTSSEEKNNQKRVKWEKATEQAKKKYEEVLNTKLSNIAVPSAINCKDVHCMAHMADVEDYTMNIMEAVESAAVECLPMVGGGGKEASLVIPGWKEYVKPFAEENKFWHAVWVSAGKPPHGHLCEIMKESKLQYKYAIRRLKRANQNIQNDKFIQSIIEGGSNIFAEIKRFRGKSSNCSSRIDGEVGSTDIANRFADIYSQLYNTHSHGAEFEQLRGRINAGVEQSSLAQVELITPGLVQEALKSLKKSKNDAIFSFQSDCLINAPGALAEHLADMIRAFLIHGAVPQFLLVCTLLPLVKDKLADITCSDNYRAIASGSLVLKLLDAVILLLEGEKLGCDQLQFGFQGKSSTVMCSWTATTVIEHYNRQGSVVYGCAMDLSKAFDLVEWVELFSSLLECKFSAIFLRLLFYIYKNQCFDVKWGSSYSQRFFVSNGVRQGAVSSPLLFSIYINDLIVKLRRSGLGCRIDHCFYGCLGYADDLLLLSSSRSGLQAMVKICESFAKKKHLKFSTNANPQKSKTKCLIFSPKLKDRQDVSPILLNSDPLPWVSDVKHLGNILQCENTMKKDVAMKRGKFIGKVNSLLQELHFADPSVLVKLIQIYCTSFYGSCLWDIYSTDVDRLYKSWNVTIRKVFKVPNTTHRYLVQPLSNCDHPKTMLSKRFLKFMMAMMSSNKPCVSYLARLVKHDNRTLAGRTLSRLSKDCNVDRDSLTVSSVSKNVKYFPVPDDHLWKVQILKELINVERNLFVINEFSSRETSDMINFICTS